jgi:RNA polymerase sigma factor (sigma-70 family)
MATNAVNGMIRHLRRAAIQRDAAALTDGELLEQYLAGRDETAFEVLLRRHGAMVLGVCRRILRNEADAEDAFQATFLVFVRKASSIRSRGTVSNWLYGVAYNTALKAKAMNYKRHTKEREAARVPTDKSVTEIWQDLQTLLDGELSRLPDKYRIPIVLCELEGKTIKEAARHLRWPQGTVATRLARGRAQLAKMMTKRGLTIASGIMAAAVSQGASSLSIRTPLMVSTVQAATAVTAGQAAAGVISTKVAALSDLVVKTMLVTRLKTLAAVLLAITVLGGGTVLLTYPRLEAEPQADSQIASASASSPDDQRAKQGKAKENRDELKEAMDDDAKAEEAQAKEAQAKEAQAKEAKTKEDAKKAAEAADALSRKIEPQELLTDFLLARRALEEAHSGIYRYTSKKDLDGLFEKAEKSLAKPMSRLEFYRVLAPVVAAIKCGHTDIWPATARELMNVSVAGNPLFPLYVRVLEGKVYALKDFSGQSPSLVGKEIRSVNGVASSNILDMMLAAARGDGDIQSSRFHLISGWRFSFQLLTLMGMRSPYEVTLWDSKKNREIKARLAGANVAQLQDASGEKFFEDQRLPTAAQLKFLDEGKIAVMSVRQFSEFVDADRKKTLAEFFHRSFGAMKEAGTSTLVLDVRNNGGGADELGKLLLSYLLDKPFKYYDDLVVNAVEFRFTRHRFWQTGDQMERRPDGKYRMVKHPNWGL